MLYKHAMHCSFYYDVGTRYSFSQVARGPFMNKLRNGVCRGLCLFFHDSLHTESSDFKSARCQAGIFGKL